MDTTWRSSGCISRRRNNSRVSGREQTRASSTRSPKRTTATGEKWDEYASAADQMILRTTSNCAQWHVIPANDKKFALDPGAEDGQQRG